MKIKKNNLSLNTKGLNEAVKNSKNSKTSKRMSQIATLIMTFMFALTLSGCDSYPTSLYGSPKDATSIINPIDKNAMFNVIDDVLEAELGTVWTESEWDYFENTNSYQEMYIKTPEDNLDFAYYNKESLSIGEIISKFKIFLSPEDKNTETDFVEVTNGTVIKDSNDILSSTNDEYSIFENVYILRYNQEKSTFSIFSLETTIAFSDLETSNENYPKYTSTPETRTTEDNNLKYNSVLLPKSKVKK